MDYTKLFCEIDDFVKEYNTQKTLISNKRNYPRKMHDSEIITILVWFHISGYRNLKTFYLNFICKFHTTAFNLVSYTRFVELQREVFDIMCVYLCSKLGKCTGISFIDSTKLSVCNNKRITRNKVFKNIAKIGKTTMGWFYGFKLHLITNDKGELLSIKITTGNTDDRKVVLDLSKNIFGKLFGDKGYISSKLAASLVEKGITLFTGVKNNMKNKLLSITDKILLRKRSIIETINDQLKNIYQVEHTRHRSPDNFVMNLLSALTAYCLQPKKPSIKNNVNEHMLENLA